jgi:hypothetical protein
VVKKSFLGLLFLNHLCFFLFCKKFLHLFVGGHISKGFTRNIIEPVFKIVYLLLTEQSDVRSFRYLEPNTFVDVLYKTLLPRTMTVTKKYRYASFFCECFMFFVLNTVVISICEDLTGHSFYHLEPSFIVEPG